MSRSSRFVAVALSAGVALYAASAAAQSYPSKPIRFVSQFPPGGGTDIVARIISPKLGDALGQQVVVDNKAGAAGNIAAEYVVKSPPDGYTILVANNTISINAAMPRKPNYDVTKDLLPVAVVGATPVVLAVHPSFPASNVAEFVKYAKANSGKMSYSSCAAGSAMHLAGELLKQLAQIEMVHVPYKGCGPAIVDGIGGQVPVLMNTITNTIPQARAGKLRILGVASAQRSPIDNTIPTIAESYPGFDADIWFGFFAPVGTPPDIIGRLNTEINKIIALPEIRDRMHAQFFSTRSSTPQQLADLVKTDIERWGKLIRDKNIKNDE